MEKVLQDRGPVESNHRTPDSRPLTPAFEFSGGCVERATPVPIPNTEVKPLGADGTARATVWESRKPPGLLIRSPREKSRGLFRCCEPPFACDNMPALGHDQNEKVKGSGCRTKGGATGSLA